MGLKRALTRAVYFEQGSRIKNDTKKKQLSVITLEEERMIREEFLKTKIVDLGFDERSIQRSREQQEALVHRAETRRNSRTSLFGRMFSSNQL